MRWRRTAGLAAAAMLLAGGAPAPVVGQEPTVVLPETVRTWLERDQVQRWRAMLAEGDSLFNGGSCRRCHGDGGAGGRFGPDLTDAAWVQSDGSLEEIRRTIFWGVRRELFADPGWRFEMNPGGGQDLTWDQHASLAAYVWSLSNGSHLPEG